MNNADSASPFIFEVNTQNVRQVVLEASAEVPVLLDVWATWCQPCKALTPILEKLAAEYKGRFYLAKLDADAEQALTMQLGVQSLPTLKLIVNGQVAGELNGLQPESVIRDLLDKFVKPDDSVSEKDQLFDFLRSAIAHQDIEQAKAVLAQVLKSYPDEVQGRLLAIEVLLLAEEFMVAKEQFETLSVEAKDSADGKKVAAKLYLLDIIHQQILPDDYRALLLKNPKDADALYHQVAHLAVEGSYDEALESLWLLFQSNMSYRSGEPKVMFLKLFDLLGKDDERSHTYRRKMFNFLH
ncbi:MAG TPA: tetratricopeptide repeat protein [Pseudomonadales bacterium]|nr:tetratricopeptide repeat protein [Pseudomonadales bacterium]